MVEFLVFFLFFYSLFFETYQRWITSICKPYGRATSNALTSEEISKSFIMMNLLLFSSSARAESARAVTADGALTVGRGKTFWRVNLFFFTKTAVTQERKVKKSLPRWEMNGLSKGYKWAVDQNWGYGKNRIFRQKPRIRAQKNPLLDSNHVLATTRKSCSEKKVSFSQINISLLRNFGRFFWLECIFGQKNTFRLNVNTAVSP